VKAKLTDVVALNEALIEKIAAQSDQQEAGLSIRELERIRDENLVSILQGLKTGHGGEGWGAGKLLAEFEERLRASTPAIRSEARN
jgi:carnitine 3-dehydrogenase